MLCFSSGLPHTHTAAHMHMCTAPVHRRFNTAGHCAALLEQMVVKCLAQGHPQWYLLREVSDGRELRIHFPHPGFLCWFSDSK